MFLTGLDSDWACVSRGLSMCQQKRRVAQHARTARVRRLPPLLGEVPRSASDVVAHLKGPEGRRK